MFRYSLLTISFAVLVSFLFFIKGATAAITEPCPDGSPVKEAQKAKAQAEVAYNKAVADELIDKPESVLAMTCFGKAAKVSSKNGGHIFSGDFSQWLDGSALSGGVGILDNALKGHFENYQTGTASSRLVDPLAPGTNMYDELMKSVTINLDFGVGASSFNCDNMDKTWNDTASEGVRLDIPYMSFEDMLSGTVPAGSGTQVQTSINASVNKGTLGPQLQQKVDDIPTADRPDLSGIQSVCDLLIRLGLDCVEATVPTP